jgi:hypothetical protein
MWSELSSPRTSVLGPGCPEGDFSLGRMTVPYSTERFVPPDPPWQQPRQTRYEASAWGLAFVNHRRPGNVVCPQKTQCWNFGPLCAGDKWEVRKSWKHRSLKGLMLVSWSVFILLTVCCYKNANLASEYSCFHDIFLFPMCFRCDSVCHDVM